MTFLVIHSSSAGASLDAGSPSTLLGQAFAPNRTSAGRRFLGGTRFVALLSSLVLGPALSSLSAPATNFFSAPLTPGLPDTGPSLLRVLGALALVLGLFLGGVWFVRNGRFSALGRRGLAKLNVLETRSLGARQAICVVAYGSERFLIGSTPAGIHLISHLSADTSSESDGPGQPSSNLSFGQALAQVLRGPKDFSAKTGGKP